MVPGSLQRGSLGQAPRRRVGGRLGAPRPGPAVTGAGSPLPAWARVTAATLPRTTATILELDDLHRTKSPLDPKLRAMVRWVVAEANRCRQSQTVAVFDLKRA